MLIIKIHHRPNNYSKYQIQYDFSLTCVIFFGKNFSFFFSRRTSSIDSRSIVNLISIQYCCEYRIILRRLISISDSYPTLHDKLRAIDFYVPILQCSDVHVSQETSFFFSIQKQNDHSLFLRSSFTLTVFIFSERYESLSRFFFLELFFALCIHTVGYFLRKKLETFFFFQKILVEHAIRLRK